MTEHTKGLFAPLDNIKSMIRRFRQTHPNEKIYGHAFSRDHLERILGQPGCEGIRIYYALDDAGHRELVILGIDADRNDIIPAAQEAPAPAGARLFSAAAALDSSASLVPYCPSAPCPNLCGSRNILD